MKTNIEFITTNCVVCGNMSYEIIHRKNNFKLVECKKCGHNWINPTPSPESIYDGYKSSGTSFVPRDDYFQFLFDIEEYENEVANRILNSIEILIERGTILDVGSGAGFLLNIAKQRGWVVQGVEIAPWGLQASEKWNVPIYNGPLECAKFADESFDVVTCIDVIEHTYDPNEMFENVYNVLKPGGIIVIQVPNIQSVHGYFKSKWELLCPPGHLHYFKPKTMKVILEKHKFKIVSTENIALNGVFESITPTNLFFMQKIIKKLIELMKLGDLMTVFAKKEYE